MKKEQEIKLTLSPKVMFNVRQFALDEYRNRTNRSREDADTFTSRCWINGLIRSLNKEGYDICLIKESKLYALQSQ